MSQFSDYISHIESLPSLVQTEARVIDDRARLLISTPQIYGIRQVVLTGSGDSYFAAAAAAPALRAWTGLPDTALPAMEAARYLDTGNLVTNLGHGLLVVAVSNSGEAARVVEAAARLGRQGALTLAITAAPESRLALAARHILDITVPPAVPAPGTRSYVACLLALYALGIRLAEVRLALTMDEANALRSELAGLGPRLAEAHEVSAAPLAGCVNAWSAFRSVDVLGSGPALASAGYGAAKLVEAAGLHATAQDAEEFHHLNYFADDPATLPTITFVSAESRAFSRTRELVSTLAGLGRPSLVLSDGADLPDHGTRIDLPPVREWFAPVLHSVPMALLAALWAEQRGATHYQGQSGRWTGAKGAGLVRNSSLEP